MLDFYDYFLIEIVEYKKLITRNPFFLEQVEGIGVIGGEEEINWHLESNGIFRKFIIMSVTTNLIWKSSGKKEDSL
ncbi:hypothetical protein Gotur_030447, partial [Gossypium turneri]